MKRIAFFFMMILTDLCSLTTAFFLAYFVRISILPGVFGMDFPPFFPLDHFLKLSYMLLIFLLIFSYEKLYAKWFNFFEELLFIIRGVLISVVIIAVFVYFSRTSEMISRTILVLMFFFGIMVVPSFRYVVKKFILKIGFYSQKAVLVGVMDEIEKILPTLNKLKETGYHLVEILDVSMWLNDSGVGLVDFRSRMEENHNLPLDTIIFVSEGINRDKLNELINVCENYAKEIKIVSDSGYLKTIGVQTEYLDELLIMRMANNLLSPVNGFFKRVFDLMISFTAIFLLAPLFLLISVAIKLESKGSIFYVQERFGKEGKIFNFIKFRSMYMDGDKKLSLYLKENPKLKEEWDTYKKLKSHDPRVTKTGRILRRFSLDELPQIFNVFLGNMSVVGPRPYLVREQEEIRKSSAIIFKVKSGITGLWQIRGRNELSFKNRLKLDEFYVRNWSFLLDMMIILRTFGVVIRGKGAY